MKKALAMLLTLAMALSMLPMAFADVAEAPLAEAPITVDEPAPADTAPVPTEEAPLADVDEAIQTAGEITASVNAGETAFERLKTSIADAAVNGTVTLTENVDCGDKSLAIDKNITLDLNGRTISGTNTAILVAGPATIKNGTVTGGNTGIVATTVPLAGPGEHETPERAGDLILQDVHVTGATRTAVEVGASYANSNLFNGHVVVKSTKSNGTVLTGGIGGIYVWTDKQTVSLTDQPASTLVIGEAGQADDFIQVSGPYYGVVGNGSADGTVITINSGTVQATHASDATAIFHPQVGTLTVNGGKIEGLAGVQFTGAGKVIINGGTITAKEPYTEFPAKDVAEGDGSLHDGAALSLVTRGGGYQGEGQTMTAEINGGVLTSTYNAAVATYRVAKKDGMWKVGNASGFAGSKLAALTIKGGTFTSGAQKAALEIDEVDASGKASLSGGTFNTDVSAYLADGYKLTQQGGKYVVSDDMAAAIGNKKFSTLAAALAEAGNTQSTISLLNDVTEDVTVAASQNIILDLDGHKMTNKGGHTITNSGTLVIKDSSAAKTGTVDNVTHGRGALVNNGTVTLEGGTFTRSAEASQTPGNSGGNSWYVIQNKGTIAEIKEGVHIVSNGYYSSLICNVGTSSKHARIEKISGGEFKHNFVVLKNDDYSEIGEISGGTFTVGAGATQTALLLNYGTVNKISGGTFTNEGEWSVIACSNWKSDVSAPIVGKIENISGGTFTATGNGSVLGVTVPEKEADRGPVAPELKVTSGTFTGKLTKTNAIEGAKLEVTGGTFNTADVNDYVAKNYMAVPNEDGKYVVGEKKVAEKPAVEVPADTTLNQEQQEAVTTAVEGIKPDAVADKVDGAALAEELSKKPEVPKPDTENEETTKVELGLQVTVKNDTKLDGDEKVLSLDVKPVATITVLDKNGNEVQGKTPATVPVPNETLTATKEEPIALAIPLPSGFVQDKTEAEALVIKHTADDGTVQYLTPLVAEQSGSFTLTVNLTHFSNITIKNKVTADGLTISPAKLNATTGSPVRLTATLTPADATENITWSSSDETIATVNGKGEVLPLKPGTVTITATADGGQTATAEVTITNPAVIIPDTGIKLDKASLELEPGKTGVLKATLTPSNATYKYIFWESSDEKVATVSDGGLVTAVAEGTATITAKSWYGNTAACEVTVKKADVPTPPDPVDPWPTEGLEGFVTRCYRVALSRDPDKAGHADWVRWLKDGTVDATSCTYGFVFSKEMNNKKLSDEDFVKTLYNLFMDREGEATGVAFWTKYLKDGHSRLEVFNGFTDSVEFARIKASYGIK